MIESPATIDALLDSVMEETMAVSETMHESAHREFEQYGRGAYVVLLNKEHMLHSDKFVMVYSTQQQLCTFECETLTAFVREYDPSSQFVLFPIYTKGSKTYNKSAIFHRDVRKVVPEIKDCNGQSVEAQPPTYIDTTRCNLCYATHAKLSRCGKCHTVAYCSRECQVRDWSNHKPSCSALSNVLS